MTADMPSALYAVS